MQAAKLAGAEQAADMAEFDENFSSQGNPGGTEVNCFCPICAFVLPSLCFYAVFDFAP